MSASSLAPYSRRRTARSALAAVLGAIAILLAGCSLQPRTISVPGVDGAGRPPVILVPGLLGSRLDHVDSGRSAWGRGVDILWPRDGGYEIALPLDQDDASPELVATDTIETVGLLGYRRHFYSHLTVLFEKHGYRVGDLAEPTPDDDFLLFHYDFRRDPVTVSRQLARQLEALRAARGEERLTARLLCQSTGAHVCRYLVKYGGASLAEAEAGASRMPTAVEIDRVALVGTANGGGLRTLQELDRGRTYLGWLGRRFRPETLFTFRSLCQELPAFADDLFVDPELRILDVDLWQVESWQRYGWSVWDEEVVERLARRQGETPFGDGDDRVRYLERCLDDARRVHRLLRQDAADFAVEAYLSIQNREAGTPRRAVLVEGEDGWHTWFPGDPELRAVDPRLRSLLVAAGDGHATVESQSWLSPQEREALVGPPVQVEGTHFGVITRPEAHRALLRFFDSPE